MVEERIVGDLDFVEEDRSLGAAQADGHGVADEMDFVAAGGQFDAEFGGDHA